MESGCKKHLARHHDAPRVAALLLLYELVRRGREVEPCSALHVVLPPCRGKLRASDGKLGASDSE